MAPTITEMPHNGFRGFISYAMDRTDGTSRIWRGQACETWQLKSKFVRELEKVQHGGYHVRKAFQTDWFIRNARGRLSGTIPPESDEDEWMALGQHHGLATPLLDWSYAPFIALFFAFQEERDSKSRAVYEIDRVSLSHLLQTMHSLSEDEKLRVVYSNSSSNRRLISQRGLFTYCPNPYVIEDWINDHMPTNESPLLIKHVIPNRERDDVLKVLHAMNISFLTLYPDVEGAALHTNLGLSINGYR